MPGDMLDRTVSSFVRRLGHVLSAHRSLKSAVEQGCPSINRVPEAASRQDGHRQERLPRRTRLVFPTYRPRPLEYTPIILRVSDRKHRPTLTIVPIKKTV